MKRFSRACSVGVVLASLVAWCGCAASEKPRELKSAYREFGGTCSDGYVGRTIKVGHSEVFPAGRLVLLSIDSRKRCLFEWGCKGKGEKKPSVWVKLGDEIPFDVDGRGGRPVLMAVDSGEANIAGPEMACRCSFWTKEMADGHKVTKYHGDGVPESAAKHNCPALEEP